MKFIKGIQITAFIVFVISFWQYTANGLGNYNIFIIANLIVIITLLIDYGYQIYKNIKIKGE